MDWIDDHGPGNTARHKNRRDGRLSAAEVYKHSPRLCRQHDNAVYLLGWQQSRCLHHQSRTAGLTARQLLRPGPRWKLLTDSCWHLADICKTGTATPQAGVQNTMKRPGANAGPFPNRTHQTHRVDYSMTCTMRWECGSTSTVRSLTTVYLYF